MRKGSTTTNSVPAYLYQPICFEPKPFTNGSTVTFTTLILSKANTMISRISLLANQIGQLTSKIHYPQLLPWKMWTPPPEMMSCMTSCLLRKTFPKKSLLGQPIASSFTGAIGLLGQILQQLIQKTSSA